jgi:hypothetical protein
MKNIIYQLANKLEYLRMIEEYKEFGKLQKASKDLFQYAFESGIIELNKELEGELYYEYFTIKGNSKNFDLNLIGIEYQEKTH